MIEVWRRHYNHIRPHSNQNDLTPIEFKTRYDSTNPGAILKQLMVRRSLGGSEEPSTVSLADKSKNHNAARMPPWPNSSNFLSKRSIVRAKRSAKSSRLAFELAGWIPFRKT